MTSDVFFTGTRTTSRRNLLDRLEELVLAAGLDDLPLKGRMTAVKIHFGEPGNLATIRPNYVARLVRMIRERGGKTFLTDANTLYKGQRANAVDHLQAAMENGYNPLSAGCPVVIADGLWGFDYREIEVNLKHFARAKIASAIAEADVLISMNHFKGHEQAGFGGALKNLGMGSGSREGKMAMHCDSPPRIQSARCVGCGECVRNCAHGAVRLTPERKALIDQTLCVGCGQCVVVCPAGAAQISWGSAKTLGERIAEYAFAALKGKPAFHVNFLMDVSPNCDCWNHNDTPIVPDIGIAASKDPVALDQASVDLVNQAPVLPGSALQKTGEHLEDKFQALHPDADWERCLVHAEAIGLGTRSYRRVDLP
ncbi:MAG TPA: DUF362 domain-containing protein [Synergistales bacterium]|nr:DUF362 domain-containing protein [Synergistales bacterium]